MTPKWNLLTTREGLLIHAIMNRVNPDQDRMELEMSLTACHLHAMPLDLERMLSHNKNFDLLHDVYGIHRHLNKETLVLEGCFVPRFAKE